ncbi:lanthionine synthetase C family protein [Streptosporangium sp. KLBMP 9127]|nr:lanthionine synthetase C family protein [Streptosporangium sp. KLBMP 9127]
MSHPHENAREIVSRIAERLGDPEHVLGVIQPGSTSIALETGGRREIWHRPSLGSGYGGLALFYAELARSDAKYAPIAREYVRRTLGSVAEIIGSGLYQGAAGIGFILDACARSDCGNARDVINTAVGESVRERADQIANGGPRIKGANMYRAYDVIQGLTGIGAYLLKAGNAGDELLLDVLDCLVKLGRPRRWDGAWRPGWWIGETQASPITPFRREHLNLGLAHGISGPLALFSLAWSAGRRAPDQAEAAAAIAETLVEKVQTDEAGPHWARLLEWDEYQLGKGVKSAPTWCYGGLGVARALQLAGHAFGEDRWVKTADDVFTAELARLADAPPLPQAFICHGWAGVLQTVLRYAEGSPHLDVARHADFIVERIVERYDDDLPFGFRVNRMGDSLDLDIPGLLEGAAGVALALDAYLNGTRSATGWDSMLLLS